MSRGITIDGAGARSVPAAAFEDAAPCLPCPSIARPAEQAVKGSELRVVRCAIHGIAFDSERETCPECAKPDPA